MSKLTTTRSGCRANNSCRNCRYDSRGQYSGIPALMTSTCAAIRPASWPCNTAQNVSDSPTNPANVESSPRQRIRNVDRGLGTTGSGPRNPLLFTSTRTVCPVSGFLTVKRCEGLSVWCTNQLLQTIPRSYSSHRVTWAVAESYTRRATSSRHASVASTTTAYTRCLHHWKHERIIPDSQERQGQGPISGRSAADRSSHPGSPQGDFGRRKSFAAPALVWTRPVETRVSNVESMRSGMAVAESLTGPEAGQPDHRAGA